MEIDSGMGDFLKEEDGKKVMDEHRHRRIDDHSSALAEKLLQGWTLLNEHCPQCLTPLVRNRQKKMYCAACRQWVLTEAEAAGRALQQQVEHIDVGDRSNSLTPASAAPKPLSPASNNGKGSGVGLSFSFGRSVEEKVQDDRNPKRVASSDHVWDGVPCLALTNGNENINQNLSSRPGGANPAQSSLEPALVIQPTVNPGNDIVARRTLTTLNEKMEGIRQLISNSHDVNELRQLFAVLEECIHAIEVTRQLLKSVE